MQCFFCDVYDVPDISFVQKRLKDNCIVNIIDRTFNEKALCFECVLKDNLLYHLIWRIIFGIRATKIQAYEYAVSCNNNSECYTFAKLIHHMKNQTFFRFGHIALNIDECQKDFDRYSENLTNHDFVMHEIREKLTDRFADKNTDLSQYACLYDAYKFFTKGIDFVAFDDPDRYTNPVSGSILIDNVARHFFPFLSRIEANRFVFLNDYHFLKRCMSNHGLYAESDSESYLVSALKDAAGTESVQLTCPRLCAQLPRIFKTFVSFSTSFSFCKSIRNCNFNVAMNSPIKAIEGLFLVDVRRTISDLAIDKLVVYAKSETNCLVTSSEFYTTFFKRLLNSDPRSLLVDKMMVDLMKRVSDERFQVESIDHSLKTKKHCVLLVDNRANIWSVTSCLITLSNLDKTLWDVVVCSRESNFAFYKTYLGCRVISNYRMEIDNFDQSVYTQLMKDATLWEQLNDYDKCIVIQDDGMIVRKGLETSGLMDVDYVGAPWADVPTNARLKRFNNDLVGNGGLSLRTVSVMEQCCLDARCILISRELWLEDTDLVPEDVFFSKAVQVVGGVVADLTKAMSFSSEQILNTNSFGFHKFWPYHSVEAVKQFITQVKNKN